MFNKIAILVFAAAIGSIGAHAQQPKASSPNLSGYWQLQFDSRNVPRAKLTQQAAIVNQEELAKADMYEVRWCHAFGVPYLMGTSPIQIAQNSSGGEIAIVFSTRNPTRHIYLDRPHPRLDLLDPTSNGHSIGKWDGATLVVDTVGFGDEGLKAIPGGGRRTKDSHLVERYKLIEGGNQLSVVSTWTDPSTFTSPHTYEFRYHRLPKGVEMPNVDCNPADEARGKFLLNPPGTQVP